MGPDNTPDITSHHLHNLYHRFIRLSIFYKMPYNKDIGDKVQTKFGQELLKLNLYHCLWIAIIYTINFDTIDAINHRAAQLFMLRITLISLTRLRKEKRGREIFLMNFDIFDFEGFMIFKTKEMNLRGKRDRTDFL